MTLPNKVKWQWIIWWLVVIPITYEVLKHVYQPNITLGDIIVLTTTIPSLAFGAYRAIDYVRYKRHPFILQFQNEHPFIGKRPTFSKLVIPLGEQKFKIRMRPRRQTLFDRIHVRLVYTKRLGSQFPLRQYAGVTAIGLDAEGLVTNEPHSEADHTNGIQTILETPWRCAPEDSLYLNVTIDSKIEWQGYVMAEAATADGHKGQGYLQIRVVPKQ